MDPGVSLFSGEPEPLHLNDSQTQREEEEEALEDQRRRDQELKNLLTDAFDDLMDEEDEDDQSTVSSVQQNGFGGHSHSNTGSIGSNHQSSPQYYPYNNHAQSHPSTSPVQVNQLENVSYQSPGHSQPAYENHEDQFDINQIMSRFRSASGTYNDKSSPNGYANSNEIPNMKNMASHQQEADHFGYLSSIPHADYSTNGHMYNVDERPFNGSHPNEDIYRQTDLNSQDQLMVLYTTRMQEVSQLTKELTTLRYERDTEVEQLKRKILLIEAEKQGAFLSHKEAQKLLSEYQAQISQLRQDVEDLRLKNITLEKNNEEISRELEIAKASAVDLTQKVSMLEKNGKGLHSEKHVESFLKNVQQQHDTQIRELQSQIESLTHKFSQKDHECCVLEHKLREVQRSQEAMITEKAKVVNELHKQLEEAQHRVREYSNSIDSQDILRLKIELDQMKTEKKTLESKLSDATNKMESMEKDLRQYEAVSKMGLLHNGDSSFETDSITHLGISRRHSLGGRTEKSMISSKDSPRRSSKTLQEQSDLNIQLRDELHRALQGQKSKREEIRRLQAELAVRDQKIKSMKEHEKVYFAESEKFKKNLTTVLERLKRQEEEAKALQGKSDEANLLQIQIHTCKKEKEKADKDLRDIKAKLEHLKSENVNLQEQLADMELQLDQAKVKQVDQSAAEFLAFHDESLARLRQESSRQLEAQVVDYRVRMEQAHKECEEVKRLYIEVCSAKRALLTELQEEQTKVKKMTSDLEDMKEAQQSLEELHKQERELNKRLREELDKEKSNGSKVMFEKENKLEEQIKELQKEHESKICALQKAKDEAVALSDTLHQRIQDLEQSCQHLRKLEVECAELRKQAIETPQSQQAELERISRELKQSRERVIQLEKRLRAEFQSKMDVMVAERDSIQAQLKQKDAQLEEYLQALSRIRPPTREVAVNTENGTLEALRRQFDEKISQMSVQHKAALLSVEDQVKEETVRYFAEEIARMEDKHRNELGCFAKKMVEMESAFAKHLTTLKSALQLKSQEVEDLSIKLQTVQQNRSSPNHKAEADNSGQLLRYVEQLKEQTESDRNKMTEALSKWASEVKELQDRKAFLEEKLEELNMKYKNAKKAAIHYRKISEEKEKQTSADLNRIQAGYRQALKKVQEKVDGIVNGKEQEVTAQLKRIESYYDKQIKDLEKKLKNDAVVS